MADRRVRAMGRGAAALLVAGCVSSCSTPDELGFGVVLQGFEQRQLMTGTTYEATVVITDSADGQPGWFDEYEVDCSDGCQAKVVAHEKGQLKLEVSRVTPGSSHLEVSVSRHYQGQVRWRDATASLEFRDPTGIRLVQNTLAGPVAAHGSLVGATSSWCAMVTSGLDEPLAWPGEDLTMVVNGTTVEVQNDWVDKTTELVGYGGKARCLDLLARSSGEATVVAEIGDLRVEQPLRVIDVDEIVDVVFWRILATPAVDARWQSITWDPLIGGERLTKLELMSYESVLLGIQLFSQSGTSVLGGAGLVTVSPPEVGSVSPPEVGSVSPVPEPLRPLDKWWLALTWRAVPNASLELVVDDVSFPLPIELEGSVSPYGSGGTGTGGLGVGGSLAGGVGGAGGSF